MATIKQISAFLDKELRIRQIPDSSKNGLQVISSRKDLNKPVKRIAFAVDACMTTFEKSKAAKVDLIIVHHGILWKEKRHNQHPEQKRAKIKFLKKNNIALYAAHLPIDKHEKYGNNIGLARILKLKNIKRFGFYHGNAIGFCGNYSSPTTLENIAFLLNKSLKTKCIIVNAQKNKVKKSVKSICICSGKGSSLQDEAIEKKFDCFALGESDHGSACRAKDAGLNLIIAGHYATETVGVKSLMPVLKQKFNIETVFINDSTNL